MQMLLAPAKLNLALHVTGKRPDGYHLLDSLVAFLDWGDRITLFPSDSLQILLEVEGPFAEAAGSGEGNLMLRAAEALRHAAGEYLPPAWGVRMVLHKAIPVGAGLGGGSSDAAVVLRALREYWKLPLCDATLARIALTLGADVPMCLEAMPSRVGGIGEQLTPLPAALPDMALVLVHPRVPLSTAEVYRRWGEDASGEACTPLPSLGGDDLQSPASFCEWLRQTRNDLQRPAVACDPLVAALLHAMGAFQPAPLLVRMTGSGACCFALFDTHAAAACYADAFAAAYPAWWVQKVGWKKEVPSL